MPPSSPSSSQGITARTPDQFARKSVHNGRNPANTITSHSPKVTADQGLGSSSRKTVERLALESHDLDYAITCSAPDKSWDTEVDLIRADDLSTLKYAP